jgi:C4-type Zn-finger protein
MDEERKELSYTVTCASCGRETLNVREVYSQIPKFGKMVMMSMLCSKCGYRLFDTVSLEYKGPAKVEFQVKNIHPHRTRTGARTETGPEVRGLHHQR